MFFKCSFVLFVVNKGSIVSFHHIFYPVIVIVRLSPFLLSSFVLHWPIALMNVLYIDLVVSLSISLCVLQFLELLCMCISHRSWDDLCSCLVQLVIGDVFSFFVTVDVLFTTTYFAFIYWKKLFSWNFFCFSFHILHSSIEEIAFVNIICFSFQHESAWYLILKEPGLKPLYTSYCLFDFDKW